MNAQLLTVNSSFIANIYSPITALGNNAFNGSVNYTNRDYLVSVNAPDVTSMGTDVFHQ